MRCKKLFVTTAIATSFFLGVALSGQIKNAKKHLPYEPAKGFYEKPYNLEIETRKNLEGKIETYLFDKETKECQKIGPNMYVGDKLHRIESAGYVIIEIVEKKLKSVSNLYSFIFD